MIDGRPVAQANSSGWQEKTTGNPLFRDYTFPVWSALSRDDQRTIRNQFRGPYPPEPGKATRAAVVEAFLTEYPGFRKAAAVGLGWFGWHVEALFVVVGDSATRVPRKFADFLVNKGVLKQKVSPEKWIVDWRDVGGTNSPRPEKQSCE